MKDAAKIMNGILADHLKIIIERAFDEGRKSERGGLVDLSQTMGASENAMDALSAEFVLAVETRALAIVDHCLSVREAKEAEAEQCD